MSLEEQFKAFVEKLAADKPEKKKRVMSDEQRKKLSDKAKSSSWMEFRRKYKQEHPDVPHKDLMKQASEAYRASK